MISAHLSMPNTPLMVMTLFSYAINALRIQFLIGFAMINAEITKVSTSETGME